VAIYSAQSELFVSLSIHPIPGYETNPDVLGTRRVVVFTGDGGLPVFDRIFNVVARRGTEGSYAFPTLPVDIGEETGSERSTPMVTPGVSPDKGYVSYNSPASPILSASTVRQPLAVRPKAYAALASISFASLSSPSSSSFSSAAAGKYTPQSWEHLTWMSPLPQEAVDATAAAGLRQMSRLPPPEQRTYWGMVPKEYDDFEEGSTRIFRLRGMVGDVHAQAVADMVVANGGAYAGAEMLCGMYMWRESAHAPLVVTSVALLEEGTGEVFLAVTLQGTPIGPGTFTDKGVYGGKRVVVAPGANEPFLMETVFNLVRRRDGTSSPVGAKSSRRTVTGDLHPLMQSPTVDE